MKNQVLVLNACTSNEYDPAPTIVVTADKEFRRAIRKGQRLCKRYRLDSVSLTTCIDGYDTLPDRVSGIEDASPYGLTLSEDDFDAVFKDAEQRTGLRGDRLVVDATTWHITCYCKYTDSIFSTNLLSLKDIDSLPGIDAFDEDESEAEDVEEPA